ncbi:unnamed protein product [Musa acuminata var. zebrina]
MNIGKVEFNKLGICKKVSILKDATVILDGARDKKATEERCEQVGALLDLFILTISLVFES